MTFGFRALFALSTAAVLAASLLAAERREKPAKPAKPVAEEVEMFAAIEKGLIDVKLIPKDSTLCRVMIENKTKKPLNVKLPEAFAGTPVLAQFGGNNRGGGQGVGGGMGGGGMGGGGMGGQGGGGGGFFNVPPEKIAKVKVTTVCLEHGKPEPRPAMKYEIKPIGQFTDNTKVHEVCRMLGHGEIPQRAAQVASWHLNNNMGWQELAAKRIRYADGRSIPYFSDQELRAGMQVVDVAAKRAKTQAKSPGEESPGEKSPEESEISQR